MLHQSHAGIRDQNENQNHFDACPAETSMPVARHGAGAHLIQMDPSGRKERKKE